MVATPYQYEQAKRAVKQLPKLVSYDLLDAMLADNDELFEAWDNIATDEYEQRGGTLTDNTPDNETLFEDCQNWATDLIIIRNAAKSIK